MSCDMCPCMMPGLGPRWGLESVGLWDGVGLVEWKNGNAKKSHTRIYSCVVAFVFWYVFLVVKSNNRHQSTCHVPPPGPPPPHHHGDRHRRVLIIVCIVFIRHAAMHACPVAVAIYHFHDAPPGGTCTRAHGLPRVARHCPRDSDSPIRHTIPGR